MKPLNDLAVLQAAENLMFQNGQTTTLDVKNMLRQQGYEATQSEVSSRMDNVSKQENWHINSAGAYKIYKPAPDTTQTLESYWELASQQTFWEIKAENQKIHLTTGIIGTNGTTTTLTYRTNRETIREAQKIMQDKKNEGYAIAKDKRLPFAIRQQFSSYFDKKIAKLELSYFGVRQFRRRAGKMLLDNAEAIGEQEELRTGGYTFTWDLPTEMPYLQDLWDKSVWSPLDYQKSYASCLGEKVIALGYYAQNKSYKDGKMLEQSSWQAPHKIEVSQENLFQAYLQFTDGTSLKVGRFDAVFSNENDTRKPNFTFWAMIKHFLVQG